MKPVSLVRVVAWSFAVALLGGTSLHFDQASAAPVPVASPARHYAPDKEVQVLHLRLEVTPNFEQRYIRAKATLQFKPIHKNVLELRLDAKDLQVTKLESTVPVRGYQSTSEHLIVTFEEPVPPDTAVTITAEYEAEPKEGLYFRTPEMGYKEGDTHLFTQGEEVLARHWYPCLDSPNVMFTSEVICRVPEGMTVISNGRLVSEEFDPAIGLRTFHWAQEQPHVNYLITLVAGYFKKIEDRYGDVPLAFFTPPSEIDQAENSFRNTKHMMAFFEREIGVPYPWPKYYQVCVNDFVAGGMENTSATTLTDGTLFSSESENLHDSDGLVAHELAHQWFGDLVTCKDWSHIWLNEGFATYYEALYQGHKGGRDALLYDLYQQARTITGVREDGRPIVRRDFHEPREMFGYLSYQKGGWVVHMLREQLGPETFRKCIHTYLERHRHGNVVTEDLRRIVEEFTGRTFDQFFDQWVYHAGFPKLEASYSWDETKRLARLSVRQTHKTGSETLLFNVPLKIRFKTAEGNADREIQLTQAQEDFYFSLERAPTLVRLDPDYALLAEIVFPVSSEMLKVQVQDKDDVIGRLAAVTEYSKRRDRTAVEQLRAVLKNDAFYGVRLQASAGLGGMQTEEALKALLASADQEDARVRRQVLEDVGRYYREEAHDFARKALENEQNPGIRAVAIRSLAAYAKPEIREILLKEIKTESYRNQVADAAIRAMRDQADAGYIAPILHSVKEHAHRFTTHGFGQALEALATLARHEDNKDEVREFLLSQLQDSRRGVRLRAVASLGRLGDEKAVPALQKLASGSRETREAPAAQAAIAELWKDIKPGEDLSNIRKEIAELQKTNRELREDMEQLRKRFDAMGELPFQENEKKPVLTKGKKVKQLAAPSNRG